MKIFEKISKWIKGEKTAIDSTSPKHEIEFKVEGVRCGHCKKTIQDALLDSKKVEEVRISDDADFTAERGNVTVVAVLIEKDAQTELCEIIKNNGFSVTGFTVSE